MCMIDGCESWTVDRAEKRKAAKEHRCGECRRTIAKGETYEYFTGLMDGHWTTNRTCEHCISARTWLLRVCAGWVFEMVGDELREHWHGSHDYRSLWLGRAIVGFDRRWTRPDGTLMDPLPAFVGPLPHETAP